MVTLKTHRVLIVDDEPLACAELTAMLQAHHLDFDIVATVDSPAKALAVLQEQPNIDGIFLDIDLQPVTRNKRAGLDFGQNLRRLGLKLWLIYITGYSEFALEAYSTFPVCYLVKPISDAALEHALNWVRQQHALSTSAKCKRIAIRHNLTNSAGEKVACTEYVDPQDVLYVQKNNGIASVSVGLVNGEILEGVKGSLLEWEAYDLFRIHRRNLVNLHHIRREAPRIGENPVYKIGFKNCSVELDIGPDYLEALHVALKKF